MNYYISNLYFLSVQYAADLVTKAGLTKHEAVIRSYNRYGKYGKNNHKHLKEFDIHQLEHHLDQFLSIPNATLVRKTSKD